MTLTSAFDTLRHAAAVMTTTTTTTTTMYSSVRNNSATSSSSNTSRALSCSLKRRSGVERRPTRRRTVGVAATDADDAFERLVATTTADGTTTVDPRLAIGAEEPDASGLIGVVAREFIPAGTAVIQRTNAAPAYDAVYARSDDTFGAAAAISAHEGEVGRLVSDDVAMGLMLVLAARHSDVAPLGAYAQALPKNTADTPCLYRDEALEALVPVLSLNFVDQVDVARGEFALAFEDCRAIMSRISSSGGGQHEVPLTEDEFAWSWSMVRSRAITFAVRKASTGEIERKRCLVPVCDVLNHSPTSLSEDGSDGPNVRIETDGESLTSWTLTRDVRAGEALRWTYGELSNEEMWMWYGFVPENPIHGDSSVVFNLPDTVFENGLNALAKDDKDETRALRRQLLRRSGVIGLNEGEELSFVITARQPAKVLGGIAAVMCCTADEVVAIAASTVISANGGGDGALFSLDPESRRRAGRYVAWLLTQVEAFVCGSNEEEIAQLETMAGDVGDDFARRFETAKRTRAGAKGTFSIAQNWLTDEALLSDGTWVDEAAKLLVSGS